MDLLKNTAYFNPIYKFKKDPTLDEKVKTSHWFKQTAFNNVEMIIHPLITITASCILFQKWAQFFDP